MPRLTSSLLTLKQQQQLRFRRQSGPCGHPLRVIMATPVPSRRVTKKVRPPPRVRISQHAVEVDRRLTRCAARRDGCILGRGLREALLRYRADTAEECIELVFRDSVSLNLVTESTKSEARNTSLILLSSVFSLTVTAMHITYVHHSLLGSSFTDEMCI